MTTHNIPIFIDGERVCEATKASYTVKSPVQYSNVGLPGPTVVEHDPPEYTAEFDIVSETGLSIGPDSRVEIAFPPGTHDQTKWRVLELWEISEIEMVDGTVELSAWDGHIHTGVSYLGDDTMVATDDGLRDVDDGFEANVHDI